MARIKNNSKSEGLCQKIRNAVRSLRATKRHLSHQPHGSISITSDKTTQNPAVISSPQNKQVHVLHQPGLSKMIPVEFEPPAANFHVPENKTLPALSPVAQPSWKGTSTGKPEQDLAGKEILIAGGQNLAKSASREKEIAQPEKGTAVTAHVQTNKVAPTEYEPPNNVPLAKAKSKMDNDLFNHGPMFSDYIAKVRDRMEKTALNVDGDGGNSPISGSSKEEGALPKQRMQ